MQQTGNTILQLYLQQHPELLHVPYEPISLPSLPRKQCPHTVMASSRISDTMTTIESRQCKGRVLACGWCEEHAIAQEFLKLGARLRYPELFLGRRGARGVYAGCVQWEAYAECTGARYLKEDIAQLKARYDL